MKGLFGFLRKPEPAIDRRRSLDGIPVVNGVARATLTEAGRVVVVLRHVRGKGLLSRLAPPVIERRFELDELGSFVFRLIDGQRTVAGIVEAFREQYRLNRREAELSTVSFLRMLAQRRVIAVVVK